MDILPIDLLLGTTTQWTRIRRFNHVTLRASLLFHQDILAD